MLSNSKYLPTYLCTYVAMYIITFRPSHQGRGDPFLRNLEDGNTRPETISIQSTVHFTTSTILIVIMERNGIVLYRRSHHGFFLHDHQIPAALYVSYNSKNNHTRSIAPDQTFKSLIFSAASVAPSPTGATLGLGALATFPLAF